jgi:hypothetical protein
VDNTTAGIWALIITTSAGLIKQFWSDWEASKREERAEARADRERAFATSERVTVAKALATNMEHAARTSANATDEIKDALAANTALTADVGKKADAAYKEANTVNAKIESLGLQVTGAGASEAH